jgi:hypothetical protein
MHLNQGCIGEKIYNVTIVRHSILHLFSIYIYDASHGDGTMNAIPQIIEQFECIPLECKCLITI